MTTCGINFENGKCEENQPFGSEWCTQGERKKYIFDPNHENSNYRKQIVTLVKPFFGNDIRSCLNRWESDNVVSVYDVFNQCQKKNKYIILFKKIVNDKKNKKFKIEERLLKEYNKYIVKYCKNKKNDDINDNDVSKRLFIFYDNDVKNILNGYNQQDHVNVLNVLKQLKDGKEKCNMFKKCNRMNRLFEPLLQLQYKEYIYNNCLQKLSKVQQLKPKPELRIVTRPIVQEKEPMNELYRTFLEYLHYRDNYNSKSKTPSIM